MATQHSTAAPAAPPAAPSATAGALPPSTATPAEPEHIGFWWAESGTPWLAVAAYVITFVGAIVLSQFGARGWLPW
jgi:hypothetical protein